MVKTEYYCNRSAGCQVGADCPKHILNSVKERETMPEIKFVHFEGNPDYCKKADWYGYQVAEGEKND